VSFFPPSYRMSILTVPAPAPHSIKDAHLFVVYGFMPTSGIYPRSSLLLTKISFLSLPPHSPFLHVHLTLRPFPSQKLIGLTTSALPTFFFCVIHPKSLSEIHPPLPPLFYFFFFLSPCIGRWVSYLVCSPLSSNPPPPCVPVLLAAWSPIAFFISFLCFYC